MIYFDMFSMRLSISHNMSLGFGGLIMVELRCFLYLFFINFFHFFLSTLS
jgi:hypothetical protein